MRENTSAGTSLASEMGMTHPAHWILVITLVAACSSTVERQPGPRPSDATPSYVAGGTVLGVERASPTDPATHVHLILQASGGSPVRVDLGPGWYLDEQGLRFSKDDVVEVEGEPKQRAEGNVLVARRVRKGGKTVELTPSASSK
jgi:hypothetical protein